MGVDLDRGAGYGNTLTWGTKTRCEPAAQPVEIQVDLDTEKFYRMFVGSDDGNEVNRKNARGRWIRGLRAGNWRWRC